MSAINKVLQYLNGDGCTQNIDEAIFLLNDGLDNKEISVNELELFIENCLDKEIAINECYLLCDKYYKESIALTTVLANMCLTGVGCDVDISKAVRLFKLLVDNDDNEAKLKLACIYLDDPEHSNPTKAIEYLEDIKEYEDYANYILGELYYTGEYITKDIEKAKSFLKNTKEEHALLTLGKIYVYDTDEKEKGIEYLKEAIKKDLYMAYFILGECYANGLGVSKNKKECVRYYEIGRRYDESMYNHFMNNFVTKKENTNKKVNLVCTIISSLIRLSIFILVLIELINYDWASLKTFTGILELVIVVVVAFLSLGALGMVDCVLNPDNTLIGIIVIQLLYTVAIILGFNLIPDNWFSSLFLLLVVGMNLKSIMTSTIIIENKKVDLISTIFCLSTIICSYIYVMYK